MDERSKNNIKNKLEEIKDIIFKEIEFNNSIIYHYTDTNALIGIMGNNEFWASHINFINDKNEVADGKEYITKYINNEENNENYYNKYNSFTQIFGYRDCFVISFTQKSDDLSQWRGYAQTLDGVQIGFNSQLFKEIIKNYNHKKNINYGDSYLLIGKVIYDPLIKSEIARKYSSILREILDNRSERWSEYELSDDVFRMVGFVHSCITSFFKDDAFKDEAEIRVVIFTNFLDSDFVINWRVRGDVIIPYVKYMYTKTLDHLDNQSFLRFRDFYKEILITPKNKNELSIESLKYFIQNSLNKTYKKYNVNIAPSKLPYR